jgi:aldose sugar dehydrogenase
VRIRFRAALAAAATAALVAVAGCSDSGGGPGPSSAPRAGGTDGASRPPGSTAPSGSAPPGSAPAQGGVRVTATIADGLDTPWGLAFLPDGSALVGSRDSGKVTRITPKGGKTGVGRVPGVAGPGEGGEGGLLGLAVAPTFSKDHWLYAYFTSDRDNRIVRMRYEHGRLGRPSTILDGIPKGTNHNGGRIAFGPDGMLYAGTGERYQRELAQDKGSLGGKILRMEPDGSPPASNPFPHSVVYSYGHRNVQGLTWDGAGRLWASEFGQDTWDELNLIRPGRNYGWPVVEGRSENHRYVNPVAQWHTDVDSPSGVAYAKGAVWMAGLRGERLWRIPLHGDRAGTPQAFLTGRYGRLRTVARASDGSLWLTTSNTDGRGTVRHGDDRLLRLEIR